MGSDSDLSRTHAITRALEEIREAGAGDIAGVPEVAGGVTGAVERLMPLVYDELRMIARARTPALHTLQPTELVHEAWMKLERGLSRIDDRTHFFATAALAMRQVLADYAKAQNRQKRGGGVKSVTFHDHLHGELGNEIDLVVLHECLEQLAELNPRHAQVIELRIFGGLTIDETATFLGVSHGTVESDWSMARAWLRKQLAAE